MKQILSKNQIDAVFGGRIRAESNSTNNCWRCEDSYQGHAWTETTQANGGQNYEIDCFYGWAASYTAGSGKHQDGGNWKPFAGAWDCIGKSGQTSNVCSWCDL